MWLLGINGPGRTAAIGQEFIIPPGIGRSFLIMIGWQLHYRDYLMYWPDYLMALIAGPHLFTHTHLNPWRPPPSARVAPA